MTQTLPPVGRSNALAGAFPRAGRAVAAWARGCRLDLLCVVLGALLGLNMAFAVVAVHAARDAREDRTALEAAAAGIQAFCASRRVGP